MVYDAGTPAVTEDVARPDAVLNDAQIPSSPPSTKFANQERINRIKVRTRGRDGMYAAPVAARSCTLSRGVAVLARTACEL
eukprot:2163782-Rhodomonas_salina.2